MARFMAEIQGSKGPCSRLGSKSSGIKAVINGWDRGIRVEAYATDEGTGPDMFSIYFTGGSNGRSKDILIGVYPVHDIEGR